MRPYAAIIQINEVVEPHRFYLTTSASRRATGTHYTPIEYTRAMVRETLDPLLFEGENGRLAKPRCLRPPRQLLALKVCDPAMGSGAFLVEVVRYLGARLVDAWWARREGHNEGVRLYLPYTERCIFGVDINPLAVEMAKLSLWLVTLARDKPFSFLDHALKSGDSLLGSSDLEQLRRFSLDSKGERRALVEALLTRRIEEAVRLRRELEAIPSGTPDDIAAKEVLHGRAETEIKALRILADLVVAPAVAAEKPAERKRLAGNLVVEALGRLDDPSVLEDRARELLGDRRPFHWPIEFPEVFEKGTPGFDAMVGNPPYMGRQKLTGALGKPYREYLVHYLADGARGSADLVAYFFLRALQLLRDGGNFGLLATNTIAEGDTRQVGLEQILRGEGVIYAAHPDEPWPNDAAVVTSRAHVHKGSWKGIFDLSGNEAPTISAFLTPREEWSPKKLKANERTSFIGSYVLGIGFVISEQLALKWIESEARYRDVIFPYLNGEDLNSHPEQKPSRWVINFWDWPEERAREYPLAFERFERFVKPDRMTNNRKVYRDYWWHFAEKRPALYHAIGRGNQFMQHPEGWDPERQPLQQVMVLSRLTKYLAIARLPNNLVFNEMTVVFASQGNGRFGTVNSFLFGYWARVQSSSLGGTMRFAPTDSFEPFPFPCANAENEARLDDLGNRYHQHRAEIMRDEWIGLTKLYNRFHDPEERDSRISKLRDLQVESDRVVAAAYGWSDLDFAHDFHRVAYLPKNDNLRFTVSEDARVEILHRLAVLNRERYQEEVDQGLHEKKNPAKARTRKTKKTVPAKAVSESIQPSLFDQDSLSSPYPTSKDLSRVAEATAPETEGSTTRVFNYLKENPGWHREAQITQYLALPKNESLRSLNSLVARGKIHYRTGSLGKGEYCGS